MPNLNGAASPPPLLIMFVNVAMVIMFVIVKIILTRIIIMLIMNKFVITRLVLTEVLMECGSMMCPFGLPAKWLRKNK